MTERTTNIYCDECGRYDHSVGPLDPIPTKFTCDRCKREGPPAVKIQRPGPVTAAMPMSPEDVERLLRERGVEAKTAKVISAGMITPDKLVPPSELYKEAHPMDEVESLFDGGWIERYHLKGQRMLTRQSVAEHSWRMAAIIYAIVGTMAREALIWATLFHDVSERVTGDMPANVKRANPAIADALHEISLTEEVRLHIRFDLSEQEQRLLGWVDRFEGALHCADELEMGNRKIAATMLRYQQYYMDEKYKLQDKENEAKRQKLMEHLNQRIKELLK